MLDQSSLDQLESLGLALGGLDAALRRLDAATSAAEAFVPLAEVCWWVVSLDEGFGEFGPAATDAALKRRIDAYIQLRDADNDGLVVGGLRHMRNAIGHDRLITVAMRGLTLPFRLPNVFGETLRWRSVDEIPSTESGAKARAHRETYERVVEGQPVSLTMRQARTWLARCLTECPTWV
jgi:hypothetical protein